MEVRTFLIKNQLNHHDEKFKHLYNDDKSIEYVCHSRIVSSGFTLLHKLVLLTSEFPIFNTFIDSYWATYYINSKNKIGWDALILACMNVYEKSSLETIKILLEHGADVNTSTKEGFTPLLIACMDIDNPNAKYMIELLLKHGADIHIKTNKEVNILHVILNNKINGSLNLKNIKLPKKVYSYISRFILFLLKNNVDVNCSVGKSETTPLMSACFYSYDKSIVELLLHHGANVNCTSLYQWSALNIACRHTKNIPVICLLLQHGADITNTYNNKNALILSSMYSNTDSSVDVVKVLLDHIKKYNIDIYFSPSILDEIIKLHNTTSTLYTSILLYKFFIKKNPIYYDHWYKLMLLSSDV